MTNDISIGKSVQQDATVFQVRFSRCQNLLRFIADRVLGASELVEEAVENCWISASCSPPRFEYEGAFRSWLLRILIDEALVIRGQRRSQEKGTIEPRASAEPLASQEISWR